MQKQIYSIKDSKAGIYNQPFFMNTELEAQRSFHALVKDPMSMISKFPDDFDLYQVAEFCDQTGTIIALETPKHIIKAINFVGQ